MLKNKKLLWQLFPSYLVIILIALIPIGWYASSFLVDFYFENTKQDLEVQARLIKNHLLGHFSVETKETANQICINLGNEVGTRFTVILPDGVVFGDSKENPENMDNHADRPEIKQAMSGQTGVSTRYSYTLRKKMMYVAIPAMENNQLLGVVRASLPLPTLARNANKIISNILLVGLFVAILAGGISFLIARRINRPLQEMQHGAEHYAKGDLDYRLAVPNSEEMGALAIAMNKMASQLDERVRTITKQRNELQAVLSSMLEAVIVVDADQKILRINNAARNLFGLADKSVEGSTLQEITRNADLHRFTSDLLSTQKRAEEEILHFGPEEMYLQAHGTFIKDYEDNSFGALVVLNDVTRMKKLENIRKDFVANVSHELKTPITSIIGFVETLSEGALDDRENAVRFLEIIARHADRLNAIIEDLLLLSRIERNGEEDKEIEKEKSKVRSVLNSAILICEPKASSKQVELELRCPDDIKAHVNSQLLEQAVINLVDNAIKYSDEGSRVQIKGVLDKHNLLIHVRDEGCGIPAEHIPRLFERFYRVDKARSRNLGGTGLGLAIVKHIVSSHGGAVDVSSTPEKGSLFTIRIPAV